MEIKPFKITKADKKAGRVEDRPFIRIGLGDGCGMENCKCSEGYWISMSDGKNGMIVYFKDKAEYDQFMYQGQIIVR